MSSNSVVSGIQLETCLQCWVEKKKGKRGTNEGKVEEKWCFVLVLFSI